MSFAALAALRAIDELIEARREEGFDDLDQFDGQLPDEIGSSALLVLYVLAEYAGADGYAFPSQKTLAKRCRLHDRTVRGILLALERWGLIERKARVRKDGTWTSDRIRLAYYQAEQEVEPEGNPAGLRPAGSSSRQPSVAQGTEDLRASGPKDLRASGATPAGVRPDPTTFEPVTEHITLGARERRSPVGEARSDCFAGSDPVDGPVEDLVALARAFRAAGLDTLARKYLVDADARLDRSTKTLITRFDQGAIEISRERRALGILREHGIALRGPTYAG